MLATFLSKLRTFGKQILCDAKRGFELDDATRVYSYCFRVIRDFSHRGGRLLLYETYFMRGNKGFSAPAYGEV